MADFHDRETFEAWLKNHPPTVGVALAARAALRALPLSGPLLEKDTKKWATALILPQFHALAPPRFAGTWPNRAGEVLSAAASAAHSAASAADSAGSSASSAARSSAYFAGSSAYFAAASAASFARSAASTASADSAASAARYANLRTTTENHYWRAVMGDAAVIEQGPLAETVMRRPLWTNTTPPDVAALWLKMKNDLLPLGEDWQVWTDWYDDILRGADDPNSRPLIPDLEYDRIAVPTDEDWEKGPAHVNAILVGLEQKHQNIPDLPESEKDSDLALAERIRALPARGATAVAARATLRTLPLHAGVPEQFKSIALEETVFPLCRAVAPVWVQACWQEEADAVRSHALAARAFASAAADTASRRNMPFGSAFYTLLRAAYLSIDAAFSPSDTAAAAATADARSFPAELSIETLAPAYRNEVVADIQAMENGAPTETLMRRPLWQSGGPDLVGRLWDGLKVHALALDDNWQVWTDWYEDRLSGADNGRPLIQELERDRVMVPNDDDWKQGPAHVNRILAGLEQKYRAHAPPQQAATVEVEFREDGQFHRRAPAPPQARSSTQEDRLRNAWDAHSIHLAALEDINPGGNSMSLGRAMTDYREALGGSYEEMNVIAVGVHGSRIEAFAKRADDLLLEHAAAELVAFSATHGMFIRQFDTWINYVADAEPVASQEAITKVVAAIRATKDADDLIADDVAVPLNALGDAVEEVASDDTKGGLVKSDAVRSLGNLLSEAFGGLLTALRSAGEKTGKKLLEGYGVAVLAVSAPIMTFAMKAGLQDLATAYPSTFGWLEPALKFLGKALS